MKHKFIILIALTGYLLVFCSCKDKEEDCFCLERYICMRDPISGTNSCILSEMVHNLGGTTIIVPNSYVGIVNDNNCIDTLVFSNDTTQSFEQFKLFVANPLVHNVLGSYPPNRISENEYITSTVATLCTPNGENLYAHIHYFVYPDSVLMNFQFWALDGSPAGIIDSCTVTYYKKE